MEAVNRDIAANLDEQQNKLTVLQHKIVQEKRHEGRSRNAAKLAALSRTNIMPQTHNNKVLEIWSGYARYMERSSGAKGGRKVKI
jgi:hypothetical protein